MKNKSREILISDQKVRRLGYKLFKASGVGEQTAQAVVDSLVDTSLRGIDSHGVRLIPHYLTAIELGRINKKPRFQFTRTAPAVGILDADHGFGMEAGIIAMKKAVNLAQKIGMFSVSITNSTHFGAASIYSLIAAKRNMIGIALTHSDSLVIPYNGTQAYLGTNPISFSAPILGEDPFCLDMSTSTVPWNKILNFRSMKEKLGRGWAVDLKGNEAIDPNEAVALSSLGGYKGYGLGLMVEIFSALLSDMPFGRGVEPMYPVNSNRRYLGHFVMAINIESFVKVSRFKKRLKEMCEQLRSQTPRDKSVKVQVAGDPEKSALKNRKIRGIPFPKEQYDEMMIFAKKYNLADWK